MEGFPIGDSGEASIPLDHQIFVGIQPQQNYSSLSRMCQGSLIVTYINGELSHGG